MKSDKLKRLEENLIILTSIRDNFSLDDIKNDKVDEWGLRYGLFESIQIIIDLACSIVSEKNLGIPKNYSDCIRLLNKNNYLDQGLSSRILSMIGLRNLLVHEYGIIDVEKLYEYLDHLQDIKDFAAAVNSI